VKKRKTMKKLYRSRKNKVLMGVCGGIGEYFEIDPVIIRIIFVFTGIGLLAYFIIGLIIPLEPIGS
jgi:phage shock protein C